MKCNLTINGKLHTVMSGTLLIDAIASAGYAVSRDCGGKGKCGKCAVLCSGALHSKEYDDGGSRYRLACHTIIDGDCSATPTDSGISYITLPFAKPITPSDAVGFGCAVDIGTTTVVVSKYDLSSGEYCGSTAFTNPQRANGADVISRIEYCIENSARPLHDALWDKLKPSLCGAQKAVFTGNTAMLLIAAGLNPAPLGTSPYISPTLFDKAIDGVYYPPCIHSFAGADTVTAILASGMTDKSQTALLCDIGTNGEMALWHSGKLYVCSAAAGPCFEGYGIKNGMPATNGAICAVSPNGKITTVGGAKAAGFCGSGLTDAIAYLLGIGALQPDGSMDGSRFIDGVELCYADIRAFQLAKSAIATGIKLLMSHAGVTASEIDVLYLAGGFGNAINPASAAEVGLIPHELQDKTSLLGNAAAYGAATLLTDPNACEKAKFIASSAVYIDLASDERFTDYFTDNLFF